VSLRRRVTDFIGGETGDAGKRNLLVTAAIAVSVLAAVVGYSLPAAAEPCDPGQIHFESTHADHDQHDNCYEDHTDYADVHTDRCDPV